jgi:hypothetical protein
MKIWNLLARFFEAVNKWGWSHRRALLVILVIELVLIALLKILIKRLQ